MTQKEIDNFLANTKVYVAGKSKEIQEKLFSFGFYWCNNNKNVCRTEKPFLFFREDKEITWSDDMNYFKKHEYREVSAEEILSIERIEPTYRPFKDAEECWQEMHNHPDFGWIVSKEGLEFCHICDMFTSTSNSLMITLGIDQNNPYEANKYFNNYTFTDGTPFGIKED